MNEKQMNLYFPQWQGAGRTADLYRGAAEIREKYINGFVFCEIDVSTGENNEIENNILGYQTILKQLTQAKTVIAAEDPDRIFTVGGGCDIEILPVSYLNHQLDGDLTVLWIDAHGDLNTPESSPSKSFYGMPLRVLLGEGDPRTLETAFSVLRSEQLVMIGQRDLDEPEQEYIDKNGIEVIRAEDVNCSVEGAVDRIRSKNSDNIYIHIDLDVLDLDEFPYVMVPAAGGIRAARLLELLKRLKAEFNIVGISMLEYTSSEEEEIEILSEIVRIGTSL
jgi:arginase